MPSSPRRTRTPARRARAGPALARKRGRRTADSRRPVAPATPLLPLAALFIALAGAVLVGHLAARWSGGHAVAHVALGRHTG